MPIGFNEVPRNIRVPFVYVEFDNSRAVRGPALQPYRILVIGQRLAAGTVAALTPVRVTSAAQAGGFFGAGSMLAAMLEKVLQNDGLTETWAVALDDAGTGTAATGTITVGGAAAAGTIALYIAGRRLAVGAGPGRTLAQIATAIAGAVTDDENLPVTAAATGAVVTLTARHKGTAGNGIDIRHSYHGGEGLPSGLTLGIVAMSGGATDPDIADVWPVTGDEHYNVMACPYTAAANLAALEGELADRWGPLRQIEGMAFCAATGTHAELGTLGDSRNSPHLSIMSAHASPTPAYEWAAAVAGVAAYHGNIDPARPFQTLPVRGDGMDASPRRHRDVPRWCRVQPPEGGGIHGTS